MPQMTSGKVLREARERKDYDLNTVARRLRIRPDILRAIEAGDFSVMPPRGYTRNMVNAYARLLGLNPTEIVNMYLDEAYAYQVEKARGAAPGSGFVMESDYRRPRLRSRRKQDEDAVASGRGTTYIGHVGVKNEEPESVSRAGRRRLYDDRTRYSRDDYGVTRDRVERPGRSDRDFLSHHSGYSTEQIAPYDRNAPRRGLTRDIHVGQTPMQYSAPRVPPFLQSRLVIVIAAVVVIIAIILIVMFVLGNNNKQAEEDVSKLPVSGITDTTGTNEQQEAENAQVEVAPTSSRVVYTVASGESCYVETITDGAAAVGEMLSGPAQKTVEVTGVWTITTWSPDTIKVTVDSEEVTLTANPEFNGMYAYTVDFPKALAEWKSTHNSRDSQRQAAVASASNAASQAASQAAAEAERENAAAAAAGAAGAAGAAVAAGAAGASATDTSAATGYGASMATQSTGTTGAAGSANYDDGTGYVEPSYYADSTYTDTTYGADSSYYTDGTSGYGMYDANAYGTYDASGYGTYDASGYYDASGSYYDNGGYTGYDSSYYYGDGTTGSGTQGYYSEY